MESEVVAVIVAVVASVASSTLAAGVLLQRTLGSLEDRLMNRIGNVEARIDKVESRIGGVEDRLREVELAQASLTGFLQGVGSPASTD